MSEHKNEHLSNSFFQNKAILFDGLAASLPQTVSFIDPNTYHIKYINKVERGFDIESVLGKSIFDFILPEFIETYKEKIEEVIKTRNSVTLDVAFVSFHLPEGVGWYHTVISIVYGKEKEIDCLMILSEDVSRSKRLELENSNKSERLKAIINNTKDIICSIDEDYNLIEFNSVFQTIVFQGYGVNLEAGMPILKFIDPKKHVHLISLYERVYTGETCYDIESYESLSKGNVYFETSFHPIYNINKVISGISIFSKDITERIKTENKISSALKEKEILLSEIHHRIKNNLAMVSSMLHLQEMNIENTAAKEALVLSRKRIKTTALIHELLYKNESFHNIHLNEFLIELFDLLKTNDAIKLVLNGEGISFKLNIALPLGLMLNEIMLNSFKHSHKDATHGKTEISSYLKDDYLFIEYCDCQGVFPLTVDFVNSNTTGLTLIHTFAEQINGSIELISNEPPKYLIQIPLNEPS